MDPEQRRQELLTQIELARTELASLGFVTEPHPARRPVNRGGTGSPLRSQVLDALDVLGLPAYSREITNYLFAATGSRVEPSRFGALRAQEMKADRDVISLLAADHARDLPGVKFRRGQFDFAEWAHLASDLLVGALERDQTEREQVARRLSMLPERLQIFGSEKAVDPEPRLQRPITKDSVA